MLDLMKQKKLLILGGLRYLLPVIEEAHKLGIYVITVDYLPNNIAHKFSDEYHNVSIIDKDAVLALAKELNIDGIMSFAVDPGVVTAAYVAEKMNLPFQCSYQSACILQDKGLFRKYLIDNGFNCPRAKSYCSKEQALVDINLFHWPVIVKPVDSAGSKGVVRVNCKEELPEAISISLSESHCSKFIVEDFITFEGYHSSTDVFIVDGAVRFCTFSDQLFDSKANNPYVPAYIVWPSTMKSEHQKYLATEIQRLADLLELRTGIYNIETCVGNNGKPYIMEVSPRGGGCKIAELQHLMTGINFIEAEVRKAIGLPNISIYQPPITSHWCEMIVHNNNESGVFDELWIDKHFKDNHVKCVDLSISKNDVIEPFSGANKSLGDIFLQFESRKQLVMALSNQNEWLKIKIQ